MKKLLTLCLLLGVFSSLKAQEKPKLTIEETIQYLGKRLDECEDHYRYPPSSAFADGVSRKMYYTELEIKYYSEKVHIRYKSSNYPGYSQNDDYFIRYTTQSYNPSQITSITESQQINQMP